MIGVALRVAAVVALLLALAGNRACAPAGMPTIVGLVDVSDSLPDGLALQRWRTEVAALQAAGASRLLPLPFAAEPESPQNRRVDPRRTDIDAAIRAALPMARRERNAAMLLLTDGRDSDGAWLDALHQARSEQVPVYLLPLAAPEQPRLQDVAVPARVRENQPFNLQLLLAGNRDTATQLQIGLDDDPPRTIDVAAGTSSLIVPDLIARRAGTRWLHIRLIDPRLAQPLQSLESAHALQVEGPRRALVLARGEPPLVASLRAGGWIIERRDMDGVQLSRVQLTDHDLVVLEDVPAIAPRDSFWSALETAVRQGGLGLIVTGGPRSFAAGGYRGSRLESLLPLESAPPTPAREAALVFAVDKSGSMDARSSGADRLAYAREATLAAIRAQQPGDRVAVLQFDAAPHLLLDWTPIAAAPALIESRWDGTASGGTQLAPVLQRAHDLLSGESRRRVLVLVTDGFTADAELAAQFARLQQARIDIVALAVGVDARVNALRQLIEPAGGTVLQVTDAAELPVFLRAGIDRQRAAVIRRTTASVVGDAGPLLAGEDRWPGVEAFAVTRAVPDASVWLRASSGEPLLAARLVGNGRAVAIPAGLGPWAPQWSRWSQFGRFTGELADWAARGGRALDVTASWAADDPERASLDIDTSSADRWRDDSVPRVIETGAEPDAPPPAIRKTGPGRYRAVLNAKSRAGRAVNIAVGDSLLRVATAPPVSAEQTGLGLSPDIEKALRRGLVKPWPSGSLETLRQPASEAGPGPWAQIALALFLLALLVDTRGIYGRMRARSNPRARSSAG